MLSLCVKKIIRETLDATTIVFDTKGLSFSYQAGQYITLLVRINDNTYYRSYSLGSSPFTDTYPFITVKRVKQGIVSNYLNDKVYVGEKFEVIPPQGHFTLSSISDLEADLVFIAGGSGITPLYGMIKEALSQTQNNLHLINMNRYEKDIIYAKKLHEMAEKNKERLHITHVLTKSSPKWSSIQGRLTPDRLEKFLLDNKLGSKAHYFICAPQSLIDMTIQTLSNLNIRMKQMHTESFLAPETQLSPESVDSKVTIRYDGLEEEVKVMKGERILESALNQGVYTIPYSCQNGICDTCKAKCSSGKVHMQTDEGLSSEEKKKGYILTCVAQPLTDHVIIEVP